MLTSFLSISSFPNSGAGVGSHLVSIGSTIRTRLEGIAALMIHPDRSGDIVFASLIIGSISGEDNDGATTVLLRENRVSQQITSQGRGLLGIPTYVDRLPRSLNAAVVTSRTETVGLDGSSAIGAVVVAAVRKVVSLGLPGFEVGFADSRSLLSGLDVLLHTVFTLTTALKCQNVPLGRGLAARTLAGAAVGASPCLSRVANELERLGFRGPLPGLRGEVDALVVVVRHRVAADLFFAVLVGVADEHGVPKVGAAGGVDSHSAVLLKATVVHGADMSAFAFSTLVVVVEGIEKFAGAEGATDPAGEEESRELEHCR